METLPLTSSGKVDHQALAALPAREGESSSVGYVGPRDEIETKLARIWKDLLGLERIGIKDNFFYLGGHSLLVIRMIARVEKELGKTFSFATLFQAPTIEGLAQQLRKKRRLPGLPLLVPFRAVGTKPPFFLHGGSFELSRHLGEDQPCYGLEPHGQDGRCAPETVEEMAADYLRQIQSLQPKGPYFLGGFSFGGLVAFEMAQQLRQSGQEVGLLVLIDPAHPHFSSLVAQEVLSHSSGPEGCGVSSVGRIQRQFDASAWMRCLLAGVKWRTERIVKMLKLQVCCAYLRLGRQIPSELRMFYFFETSGRATAKYRATPYGGRVALLSAEGGGEFSRRAWKELVVAGLETHELPGGHLDAIKGRQVETWGRVLRSCLQEGALQRAGTVLGLQQ